MPSDSKIITPKQRGPLNIQFFNFKSSYLML